MALLAEVDKGISQETVSGRFKCAVRTVQSIRQNRKDIQKQADTARGSRKSNRPGEFKQSRIARGNSNAYIVRDTHYVGENLCCAGARYSAGEVACTIPALYRDHYCTIILFTGAHVMRTKYG